MQYNPEYESTLLRGIDEPRPWDIIEIVKDNIGKSSTLLDIGCGTGIKLIPLADSFKTIYGVEPNPEMRAKAKENIEKANIRNIILADGTAERLPFEDNSLDMVTCMLAPHDIYEIHRVLKPGGLTFLEKIDDRDKWDLQTAFGKDELGYRGFLAHLKKGQRAELYQKQFSHLFSLSSVQTGSWNTYYSLEGLTLLLENIPLVRNFGGRKDAKKLKKFKKKHMAGKGIRIDQRRILIIARK